MLHRRSLHDGCDGKVAQIHRRRPRVPGEELSTPFIIGADTAASMTFGAVSGWWPRATIGTQVWRLV